MAAPTAPSMGACVKHAALEAEEARLLARADSIVSWLTWLLVQALLAVAEPGTYWLSQRTVSGDCPADCRDVGERNSGKK